MEFVPMQKQVLAVGSIVSFCFSQLLMVVPTARADASPTLSITELLPDPAAPLTDADDEFIEFFNASASDVNLKGYVVKSGDTLGTKHTLQDATVPAGEYLALKSADTHIALANNGSSVGLYLPDGTTAVGPIITYKTAPTGSAWAKKSDGTWAWTTTPTPNEANNFSTATPSPKPSIMPAGGMGSGPIDPVNSTYTALMLTELLPDPAAPQTDADDEFIELYNSSDQPVDISGVVVKTGASLTTKHTLKQHIIQPFSYASFRSADTKIALSNAGSSVQLAAPDGSAIGGAVTYPKAITGASWAFDGETWAWTTTLTPGLPNIIAAPATAAASPNKSASSTSTKTASSKTSSKASSSKTTKAPAASKVKTSSPVAAAADAATSPTGKWLIFALVGLTIAYCLYEFRYDMLRFYHRLRGFNKVAAPAGE
ncbi:MAG TPA: lamin tail domain-containing protein [Candidatus Saccharimonadia bacterium]